LPEKFILEQIHQTHLFFSQFPAVNIPIVLSRHHAPMLDVVGAVTFNILLETTKLIALALGKW
jgi:hypothetical protein